MAARSAETFRRRGAKYKVQPLVLIVCEDSKSSKQYLEDMCVDYRVNAKIEVVHCGKTDPKGIVQHAVTKERDYENLFCVVDRDEHTNFDEAVNMASAKEKVTLIVSYPCFEFWILLHFGFCRKPYKRSGGKSPAENLISDLKKIEATKDYTKESDGLYAKLAGPPFFEAKRLSPRVLQAAVDEGEPNPSTEFHKLVEFIEGLSEPKTA